MEVLFLINKLLLSKLSCNTFISEFIDILLKYELSLIFNVPKIVI